MNRFTKAIQNIDTLQRKHTTLGFFYAIIKKYGQDNGGYQSAIITYYGLLSLFPLLIVFTSFTQLLLKNNHALRNKIATGTTHYFPIIGSQLQHSIHSPKESGLALIVSLFIMLYGARGVASAFQYSLNSLWYIPQFKQPPFLKNVLRGLSIITIGGLGLLTTSLLSGYIATLGHDFFIKIIATLASLLLLWVVLIYLFKLAVAGNKHIHQVMVGAAIAAIGLQILQTLGGIIMSRELKELNSLYGTFALVIGLLFWIYLQVEVILYAVEIDVIRAYHLFPRSLQGSLTESDKAAYIKYTKSTTQRINEKTFVKFE
jgi:membrane protein